MIIVLNWHAFVDRVHFVRLESNQVRNGHNAEYITFLISTTFFSHYYWIEQPALARLFVASAGKCAGRVEDREIVGVFLLGAPGMTSAGVSR